jgi:hypothetical protein
MATQPVSKAQAWASVQQLALVHDAQAALSVRLQEDVDPLVEALLGALLPLELLPLEPLEALKHCDWHELVQQASTAMASELPVTDRFAAQLLMHVVWSLLLPQPRKQAQKVAQFGSLAHVWLAEQQLLVTQGAQKPAGAVKPQAVVCAQSEGGPQVLSDEPLTAAQQPVEQLLSAEHCAVQTPSAALELVAGARHSAPSEVVIPGPDWQQSVRAKQLALRGLHPEG